VKIRQILMAMLLVFCVGGCGHKSLASLSSEEIQQISSISDPRLVTSTDWQTYFDQRGFDFYDSSHVFAYANNYSTLTPMDISPTLAGFNPPTGNYSKTISIGVCVDGAYTRSVGSGTCSHHLGYAGQSTIKLGVSIVTVSSCADNSSTSQGFAGLTAHVELNRGDCSPYGGVTSSTTFAKYSPR
jgi:hypothetical protein